MSRFLIIAAGLTLLGGLPAHAAKVSAPFPMAADGTTNIADCGKVDVKFRDQCISRSRPVSGKQLYAQAAAEKAAAAKKEAVASLKGALAKGKKAVAEKVAKVKAAIPAAVVGAPKGFKIGKDGTTNVADCAKANPSVRNECISRARPMTGKELAKFVKSRGAEVPAVAAVKPPSAKAAATAVPSKPVAVAAPAAPVLGKGFKIAKDGTTDINDCGKANPNFRNECISRARPVSGAAIYAASGKPKS